MPYYQKEIKAGKLIEIERYFQSGPDKVEDKTHDG